MKLIKLRVLIQHLRREIVNSTLPQRAGVAVLLQQAVVAFRKLKGES